MKVKLTEELDQRLMNRPFYWQYVKKLGYKGDPMSVTFISNEDKKTEKGEWIHYGSPRLEQLFQVIFEEGKYTELFEQNQNQERQPLHPWFVCNLMVRYQGAYTHDEMVSVGVYLINGTMRFKMMDELLDEPFSKIIPDLSYKIPPIISTKRAVMMINHEIKQRIKQKSIAFAEKSVAVYQKEMDMTNQLFENRLEEEEVLKENIKKQIYDRLYPKVHLKLINCGLFYITESRSKNMMNISS